MASIFKTILNTIPRPWLIRCSYAVKPLLAFWYRGNKYEDPIDGKKYRKLLSYGYSTTRNNVLAPGSLSLERHRLMWLYLKNETNFFETKHKVLHIAPEQCFYSKFKKLDNINYTTLDLESPIADIRADIRDLPIDDNCYDIIFCNHVLEHIIEDHIAIAELYRVMKPGGWGIFQVPMRTNTIQTYEDTTITTPAERKIHFGQYDHVRWYGTDYFQRLEQAGFRVKTDYKTERFSPEDQEKYALMPNEILPIVFKDK